MLTLKDIYTGRTHAPKSLFYQVPMLKDPRMELLAVAPQARRPAAACARTRRSEISCYEFQASSFWVTIAGEESVLS